MQCYTRAHKFPRTTTHYDFRAPPLNAYRKRSFFVPEPDRIGRPWCPGGVVMPPPWENIKRIQYNPTDYIHRETHSEEMLEFINKTNWTCGQDMKLWGARKSKLSESEKFSLQSTQRAHYPWHWLGVDPRRNPERFAPLGTTPATYHAPPYVAATRHPLTTKNVYISQLQPEDPNTRCMRITVPNYITEPYPGPQLPSHLRYKGPRKQTVEKMGLVP